MQNNIPNDAPEFTLPTPPKAPSVLSVLYKNLENVGFEEPAEYETNFSHVFNNYVPMTYSEEADSRITTISEYKDYFDEFANKFQDLAINTVEGLDVLDTFVQNIVDHASKIHENILTGTETYMPYLTKMDEDGTTVIPDEVILAIKIAITKPKENVPPMLVWVISSHTFKVNEEDQTKITMTKTLELFSE